MSRSRPSRWMLVRGPLLCLVLGVVITIIVAIVSSVSHDVGRQAQLTPQERATLLRTMGTPQAPPQPSAAECETLRTLNWNDYTRVRAYRDIWNRHIGSGTLVDVERFTTRSAVLSSTGAGISRRRIVVLDVWAPPDPEDRLESEGGIPYSADSVILKQGLRRMPPARVAGIELSAGWPVHCLHGWVWQYGNQAQSERSASNSWQWRSAGPSQSQPPEWQFDGALDLTSAQANRRMSNRLIVVPLRPIWKGLAVNTLFYAVLLWLGLGGPIWLHRGLRRYHRTRRGQCIRCGYDLQGELDAGCPECGWRRTKSVG